MEKGSGGEDWDLRDGDEWIGDLGTKPVKAVILGREGQQKGRNAVDLVED